MCAGEQESGGGDVVSHGGSPHSAVCDGGTGLVSGGGAELLPGDAREAAHDGGGGE